MIKVNDLYQDTMMLLNKGLRGFATPAKFNQAMRQAEIWLFNHYLGRPEDYQPGRAVPRIAYGMTTKTDWALNPFKVRPVTLTESRVLGLGYFIVPLDCEYPLQLVNKLNKRKIEDINDDEMADRESSSLLAPTVKHPVAVFHGGAVRVLPLNGVLPQLSYLRLPVPAKWAYTTVEGRPVFNAGGSIDSEWLESDRNKLVERIAWQLAQNQKAGDVIQQSQIKTTIGT